MSKPLKSLVNHRDVCKAFGISTDVLARAIRNGEFIAPHSCVGRFNLFDRSIIEYRLEHGVWPRWAEFRGVRQPAKEGDGDGR